MRDRARVTVTTVMTDPSFLVKFFFCFFLHVLYRSERVATDVAERSERCGNVSNSHGRDQRAAANVKLAGHVTSRILSDSETVSVKCVQALCEGHHVCVIIWFGANGALHSW